VVFELSNHDVFQGWHGGTGNLGMQDHAKMCAYRFPIETRLCVTVGMMRVEDLKYVGRRWTLPFTSRLTLTLSIG